MLGLTVGGSKGHGAAAVSLLPSYQIHPTPCTLKYDTKFVLKKMMAISFLIARPVAKELGVKILVNTLEQGMIQSPELASTVPAHAPGTTEHPMAILS